MGVRVLVYGRYLTNYEFVKYATEGRTGPYSPMFGGLVAEMFYIALGQPVENIVVRMMTDNKKRPWLEIASEVHADRAW